MFDPLPGTQRFRPFPNLSNEIFAAEWHGPGFGAIASGNVATTRLECEGLTMAKRIRKRGELRVERATYPDGNGGRAKTSKYYGWYRDLGGRRSRIALPDDRANSLYALTALVNALKTAGAGSVVQPDELPPVVHPAKAQRLARHSDVNLTLRYYTKLTTTEQVSAVAVLPDPDAPAEQAVGTG